MSHRPGSPYILTRSGMRSRQSPIVSPSSGSADGPLTYESIKPPLESRLQSRRGVSGRWRACFDSFLRDGERSDLRFALRVFQRPQLRRDASRDGGGFAAGHAADFRDGVHLAAKSIDSGAARDKLEKLIAFSQVSGESAQTAG